MLLQSTMDSTATVLQNQFIRMDIIFRLRFTTLNCLCIDHESQRGLVNLKSSQMS